MIVSTFYDKLNKVDGSIYVVEEEIHLTNGVYEAELQHDNINEATFVHRPEADRGTSGNIYPVNAQPGTLETDSPGVCGCAGGLHQL